MRLSIALAAALILVTTACTSEPPAPEKSPKTPTQDQTSQDQTTRDQNVVVDALRRTQRAPHHFTVDAELPEKQRLEGVGAYDGTRYTSKTTTLERTVVGTDYYQREPGATWVHVDLNRLKDDSPIHFDLADATGLLQFADAITTATQTGSATYSGRFRPNSRSPREPFLPIGVPSLWSVGVRVSPFSVTLDDEGWVTSITMELSPTDSPTLTMKATLSAHGEPVAIEEPDAHEADKTLYE